MKIKWNIEGFRQLRHDPGVAADIDGRAARIAAAAGEGYESSPYRGASRHRASVITTSAKAAASERKHGKLLRSIDAGR